MAEKIEYTNKPKKGEPWDVIIIGSGPAALTAAIYTTRGAASTLVIAGDAWGGQLMLTTKVDNFPGFPEGIEGPELMQKMRSQAERFGTEILDTQVTAVDFSGQPFKVTAGGNTYTGRSVVIATGADTKWLGVPGETRLRGKGVSSCAPCDAPFFKEKSVAVVGGGDAAMEEALVLTKYSPEVTVIHRRNELRASAAMQQRVFTNKKIRFVWDTEIAEILGETKVESLLLKTKVDSETAEKVKSDKEGKYKAEDIEEKDGYLYWRMPVQGVFVAIGHTPATDIFKEKIDLDEKGYIVARNRTQTSIPEGVFVAGDVEDHCYRQAITAAGFGCQAGMDVLKYLDKEVPNW